MPARQPRAPEVGVGRESMSRPLRSPQAQPANLHPAGCRSLADPSAPLQKARRSNPPHHKAPRKRSTKRERNERSKACNPMEIKTTHDQVNPAFEAYQNLSHLLQWACSPMQAYSASLQSGQFDKLRVNFSFPTEKKFCAWLDGLQTPSTIGY